jgi:hypothetical protein
MKNNIKFQLLINLISWILEYLEMLNVYNCEQYWCSGSHFILIGISIINYIIYKFDKLIFIPYIIISIIGSLSLLFWDITWWNVSTRHRTEYYNSHNFLNITLFVNLFWDLFYLCILKKHIEDTKKLILISNINNP